MAFNVLAIGRPGDPEMLEYPSIGPELELLSEPLDGMAPVHFAATGLELFRRGAGSDKATKAMGVADVTVDCRITASRVVVYCRKFDKGGGWYGGPVAMIALNVGSKAMAAMRRRGKALVGHLRYPWIAQVLFHPKAGFLSAEFLRLVYTDGTENGDPVCFLDITLHKRDNAAALAWQIVQRLIAYRYSSGEPLDDNEIAAFEEIRRRGRRNEPDDDGSGFGSYALPSSFHAPSGMTHTPTTAPAMLNRLAPPQNSPDAPRDAPPELAAPDLLPPATEAVKTDFAWPAPPIIPAPVDAGTMPSIAPPPPVAVLAPGSTAPSVPAPSAVPAAPEPEPEPVAATVWQLELDTGAIVDLSHAVVIGRDPDPATALDRTRDGSVPVAVRVADPTLSKTHALVQPTRDGVAITDLHSTNGVAIEVAGRYSPCAPGTDVQIEPGTRIHLGDRVAVVTLPATPPRPIRRCERCAAPAPEGAFCGYCGAPLSGRPS